MVKAKKHAKSRPAGDARPTLVTFLLDRTGSMEPIRNDTIGAFNAYLKSLQEDGGNIEFSFLQFDSISIDKICVNTPVASVKPLTVETYQPRASTPLIDAACKTIEAVAVAVEKRAVKPKVVVCIQTDGEENASTEHTWTELNQLIKEKSKLGWQFNFMGAGIDAYVQGERMGIARAATVSYDRASPAATRAAFAASAENTRNFAVGAAPTVEYSPAQKAAAGDRFDSARPVRNVLARAAKAIVDKVTL
jgi:hypothetical protein